MPRKPYTSFDQIDRELEILSVQKQIHAVKLLKSAHDTLDSVTPSNLMKQSLGWLGQYVQNSGSIKRILAMMVLNKLIK